MNKYILVAEIEKLGIPCSLEFRSNKFFYLLYPYNVNERISRLKFSLNDLDNYFKNYQNNPIKNDQVIVKDENSKTIIITEIQETDESIENKSFEDVYDYFSIIIKTLNLFYTNLFSIERISIFKKIATTTKIIRIIGNYPEFEFESPIGNKLLENIDVRYFEPFFPKIVEKISENKEYSEVFDEFINGKIIKKTEYKIVYLWNTLEHISDRYLKNKKKSKIIQDTKFEELKNLIKIRLNDLDQSDLVFAENLEDARNILIKKMNNYPQIIDKILFMFKTNNLYSYDNEQIIRKVYYLRNRIFHNGIYLPQLLDKFKNKFPEEISFSSEDLKHLLKKFEYLIIIILVSLLELNQIFEIDETNRLVWKEQFPIDDSYFNYKITTEDGRVIEQVSEVFHSHFKSKTELKAYIVKTINYLSRKPKFLKLIGFLNKIERYWSKLISLNNIPSYTDDYGEEFNLRFENEKVGNFIVSSNSKFMENIKEIFNKVKGPKYLYLTTYIYILNYGTIQIRLQIEKLSGSLEYRGETRGQFYCHQFDYGNSEFKKFNHDQFSDSSKCEICENDIREVGIINPKFFDKFFPITIYYICNECNHQSSQSIFIYPFFLEQFVQIPIYIMEGGTCVRKGNGFFYVRIKDKKKHLFFITTVKMLTGSFPMEDVNKTGESAKLLFHTSWEHIEKNICIEIPLYTKNNIPIWIQSDGDTEPDFAIIPIFPQVRQHCKIFALHRKKAEIPSNLSNTLFLNIIGFKNGKFSYGIPQMMGFHLSKDEFLNLMQNPIISVEPYDGMDGSPVFVIDNNFEEGKFQLIFIGIYSDFQNGKIWNSDLIIQQINKIDIKEYISNIFSNLQYTCKIHLK